MSAALSDTSKHPYNALGTAEIRLVNLLPGEFEDPIELEIITVDLLHKPLYDALSYVWHPRDGTIDTMRSLKPALIVNFKSYPIPIGANLDAAIRHLRPKPDSHNKSSGRCLWIDALCINQDLAAERSHQVGLMKSIYSSAQRVLIWLGPSRYCSDFVLDALLTDGLKGHEIADFINCLEILLRRDWFSRVWVAQELTLARECPVVHLGYQTFSWDDFALGVNRVQQRLCGAGDVLCTSGKPYLRYLQEHSLPPGLPTSALVARARCVQHLADLRAAGQKATFSQQFFRTMYLQASDPRDKVYGLLGFSSFEEMAIFPDYTKSTEHVFAHAGAVIFQQDFCSYIAHKLWEYQRRKLYEWARPFAGTPAEQLLAATTTSNSTIVPRTTIEKVLTKLNRVHPIAIFIDEFCTFETLGSFMGRVVACDYIAFISHYPENFLFSINRHLHSHKIGLDCKRLLKALLGPSNRHTFDIEAILAFLEDHFDGFPARVERSQTLIAPEVDKVSRLKVMNSTCYEQLKTLSEYHGEHVQVFLMDTGHVGIVSSPHWCTSMEVVGLFGINLPMIMAQVAQDTYRLEDVAYVAGHTPGDNHIDGRALEAAKPYTCLSNGRLGPSGQSTLLLDPWYT